MGFTLLELLLVLTLVSSIMGGMIVLIRVVRDSNQVARQNLVMRNEIRRFADELRREVKSADRLEFQETGITLTTAVIDSRSTQIVYQVSEDSITRTLRNRGPQSDSTSTSPSRDRYVIGPSVTTQFESIEDGNAVRWTLTLSDRPKEPIEIVAYRRASR